jgi:hypothetical protein
MSGSINFRRKKQGTQNTRKRIFKASNFVGVRSYSAKNWIDRFQTIRERLPG